MLSVGRFAIVAAVALALAGCATAPSGPIPRVIDVTNTHVHAPG